MQRELADLERRNTWELVPHSDVPPGEPVAPGNWVLVEKHCPEDTNADTDGTMRKSRWVVCVNHLQKSPKLETYSLVITFATLQALFACPAFYLWHIRQANTVLAFLHGRLPHTIFMKQPIRAVLQKV